MNKKSSIIYISIISLIYSSFIYGQLLDWSPHFSKSDGSIQIIADATKGNKGLMGSNEDVYVHLGLITSNSRNSSDWKYVPFVWASATQAAKATRLGNNKWQYTIASILSFFNVPATEIIKSIAIIFRHGNCTNCASLRNTDGSDMYIPVYDDGLYTRFEKPSIQPLLIPAIEAVKINIGDKLEVKLVSSQSANLQLLLNQEIRFSVTNKDSIEGVFEFLSSGNYTITSLAQSGNNTIRDSFSFVVTGTTSTKLLPESVRPGINRVPGDTALTFVLIAPGKSKVNVLGDFPNNIWQEKTEFQMHLAPDQKTWWLRIGGLMPNTEYSFQYLVDGSLKITDPYVEKILDPVHDGEVRLNTYVGLKAYPNGQTNGIVGVINTSSNKYFWKNKKPHIEKENLIIYELLLRDFLAKHDYNTLLDTLPYLKRLGINAIELMPVSEFEGNQSWGYNPNFFFSLDKYYGKEEEFKKFVDACHGIGIMVILDIVLNHATGTCPLAALYWDGINQRPAADNPWFNVTAKHPFNVFNDFNHESKETRYFSTRVMQYWLSEYQIDGFRFDLSKGFTQRDNANDVNAWGAYDISRINIWKEYYDSMQIYSPGSYAILEHFADNVEEKVLSDYGFLLWGNSNHNYTEATMGWLSASNFDNSLYSVRNWSSPFLISYMESHDEERLMYKNLQFGNSTSGYNTKSLSTALERMKLAASFFFMTPGPKMIWQFGELGYDFSINTCTNGTVNNNCRLDNKPLRWDYLQDPNRKSLYNWYSTLLKIRNSNSWKSMPKNIQYNFSGAYKWMNYTINQQLNLVVIGNFDVKEISAAVRFPKTGLWYDIQENKTISVNQFNVNMTLKPGEYHVYTDRSFETITPVKTLDFYSSIQAKIIPNPSHEQASLEIELIKNEFVEIEIASSNGKIVYTASNKPFTSGVHLLSLPLFVSKGIYFIRIKNNKENKIVKWLKL